MTAYEEWRPVVGFVDYEVSNYGRVKSLKFGRSRILKPGIMPAGHHVINVLRNGKQQTRLVHRLVALAFLNNPDNYPVVRHLDDDPSNNSVTNLAWGTHYDNMRDAVENNSFQHREKPIRIVEDGREFRSEHACALAIQGNVSHICGCLNGRRETHKGFHYEYVED